MMKKNNIRVLAGPAPSASGTAQPFWNIAQNTEDDAEITIYGEIVTHRPTNWLTGEPEDDFSQVRRVSWTISTRSRTPKTSPSGSTQSEATYTLLSELPTDSRNWQATLWQLSTELQPALPLSLPWDATPSERILAAYSWCMKLLQLYAVPIITRHSWKRTKDCRRQMLRLPKCTTQRPSSALIKYAALWRRSPG